MLTSRLGLKRNIIAGLLTIIPLWITWIIVVFVFNLLSDVGYPWVVAFSEFSKPYAPFFSEWVRESWFQKVVAVVFTVLALYLIGMTTTFVLGKKLVEIFNSIIEMIPFVKTVYSSARKLIETVQIDTKDVKRVVFIKFPTQDMKTIGFVTKVVRDMKTKEELAMVYVPTTPNPTSGYLEVVPVKDLVSTDMSVDEAMKLIISGGAVSPEEVKYHK